MIDTNVWLDWLLFKDPSTRALERLAQAGRLRCPTTPAARAELLNVISRDVMANSLKRLAPDRSQAVAELAARYDQLVTLSSEPAACDLRCTDPDDQVFLDLAIQTGSGWLLSRDRALLSLSRRAQRQYRLTIATPIAFEN